jgi:hypothetical protein
VNNYYSGNVAYNNVGGNQVTTTNVIGQPDPTLLMRLVGLQGPMAPERPQENGKPRWVLRQFKLNTGCKRILKSTAARDLVELMQMTPSPSYCPRSHCCVMYFLFLGPAVLLKYVHLDSHVQSDVLQISRARYLASL